MISQSAIIRLKVGGMIFAGAFAALAAYTHRMSPEFFIGVNSGWYAQAVKISTALWGDGALIGYSFPTVVAGALTVFLIYLLAARSNLYWGVYSAVLMLTSYRFFCAARYGDEAVIILAGMVLAVYLLSWIIPVRWRSAGLLLYGGVWVMIGWDGYQYYRTMDLCYYMPALVISLIASAAVFARMITSKRPDWRMLLCGAGILLAVAPDNGLFFAWPVAAWSGGYVLANAGRDRWFHRVGGWLFKLLWLFPLLGAVMMAWGHHYLKQIHPDFAMPLVIPGVMYATLIFGILAAKQLKRNYYHAALAVAAAISMATAVVMILEPPQQYEIMQKAAAMESQTE